MKWQEVFDKGQELVLATSSPDGEPNICVVISLGFVDDKLLVADSQMDRTLKNLQENNLICVYSKKDGRYLRIKGQVEISDFDKYFEICQNADKNYPVKHAITISADEILDLDNQQIVSE